MKGIILTVVLVVCAALTGCRDKDEDSYASVYPQLARAESYDFAQPDEAAEMKSYSAVYNEAGYSDAPAVIIRTGNIDMETDDFDGVSAFIAEFTRSLGGYTESLNLYTDGGNLRHSSITLRVPAESFDITMQTVELRGKVGHSSRSMSDVSSQYYDTTARLESKEAEESRLLQLIGEAETMSDLIMLEQRLSTVRADIEMLKARQTGINRKASFASIFVNLSEVKDIYDTGDLFSRIGKAFSDGIDGFVRFVQNVLVFLAQALIPLIFIILMLLVGIFTYRRLARKSSKRRARAANKEKKSVDNAEPDAVELDGEEQNTKER